MIKENSKNKFLGGKLTILQQREGFRAGHDSVLLASSIPAKKGDKCLELGIGAGVVSLCLMKRVPGLSVIGIDNDRDIIKLLKENISLFSPKIDIAGITVIKIPAKSFATSKIGNQVNPFSDLKLFKVYL